MRILVLGGTQFLGRHVVDAALARGHDVTLFNRGQTQPELFPEVEKLRGDRDGDLAALEGRSFDAVVDTCGYVPRVVQRDARCARRRRPLHLRLVDLGLRRPRRAARRGSPVAGLLGARRRSYRGEALRPAQGAAARPPSAARFPDAFVPRPGLIVGPWDPTGRFTYWPQRVDAGGRVLAPAPPDGAAQMIDVRDLAEWIVDAAETPPRRDVQRRLRRPFSFEPSCSRPAGPSRGSRAGARLGRPRRSSPSTASSEWMELPLWLARPDVRAMLEVDPVGARSPTGCGSRPLAETVRDTLEWVRSGEAPRRRPGGPRPAEGARAYLTRGSRKSSFERSLSTAHSPSPTRGRCAPSHIRPGSRCSTTCTRSTRRPRRSARSSSARAPPSCSYHLRALARWGFVEEGERRRRARAAVARDCGAGSSSGRRDARGDGPPRRARRARARAPSARRSATSPHRPRWRRATQTSFADARADARELEELGERFEALLDEFRGRGARRGTAQIVVASFQAAAGSEPPARPSPRSAARAPRSISSLGTQMTWLALPWFVLATTGSPQRMTWVIIAEIVPIAVLGFWGGAIAARIGTRRTMLICDLARVPLLAAIPSAARARAPAVPGAARARRRDRRLHRAVLRASSGRSSPSSSARSRRRRAARRRSSRPRTA